MLKNTEENFNLKLPYHLINPSKSELGKVSKHKLEKTNKILVQHLNANQWKNSTNVMKFFSALENKNSYPFIKFDIQEFYPSIADGILKRIPRYARRGHSHNKPMTQVFMVQR